MWSPMKRETSLYRNDVICVILVLWKEALKWNFDDINRFSKVSRETFHEFASIIELKIYWKPNEIKSMWKWKNVFFNNSEKTSNHSLFCIFVVHSQAKLVCGKLV